MSNWKDFGTVIKTKFGFIQQFEVFESGHVVLPDDAIEAFTKTATMQRNSDNCAETMMIKAQSKIGSGVMSYCIEHGGDLTHRMTHHAKHGELYPSLIEEKTVRLERVLSNKYGFLREHEENLVSISSFRNQDIDEIRDEFNESLKDYVASHKRIPVFNKPQWHAREAAICIGKKDVPGALVHLRTINKMIRDNTFLSRSAEVLRDKDGKIIEFTAHYLKLDHKKKPVSECSNEIATW